MEYKVILTDGFFTCRTSNIPKESIFADSLEEAYNQACEKYEKYPFVCVVEKGWVKEYKRAFRQYREEGHYNEILFDELVKHMYC